MWKRLRVAEKHLRHVWRGYKYWQFSAVPSHYATNGIPENFLSDYFERHVEGPGIFKWVHYFEPYNRHFSRFRGESISLLEVGIYSGGSLGMWQAYFGPRCKIYGVDIDARCRIYADDSIGVFIGDQSNRAFWKSFRERVPPLDIVIDDGSHQPEHQIITLEELLPHLKPGGVYVCEDVHKPFNEFSSYLFGLIQNMNAEDEPQANYHDNERRMVCRPRMVQQLYSIHLYPYLLIIERADAPLSELKAPKHGTIWNPVS